MLPAGVGCLFLTGNGNRVRREVEKQPGSGCIYS